MCGMSFRSKFRGEAQAYANLEQRVRDTEHLQENIFMNSVLYNAMNKYRVRGTGTSDVQ